MDHFRGPGEGPRRAIHFILLAGDPARITADSAIRLDSGVELSLLCLISF